MPCCHKGAPKSNGLTRDRKMTSVMYRKRLARPTVWVDKPTKNNSENAVCPFCVCRCVMCVLQSLVRDLSIIANTLLLYRDLTRRKKFYQLRLRCLFYTALRCQIFRHHGKSTVLQIHFAGKFTTKTFVFA